jgi:hypothetical protein
MNTAVIGSWKKEDESIWDLTDKENFPNACRELGKEIARKGDYLFVTSDREDTADLYAVDGFVNFVEQQQSEDMKLSYSKRICVYRANYKRVFKKYMEKFS